MAASIIHWVPLIALGAAALASAIASPVGRFWSSRKWLKVHRTTRWGSPQPGCIIDHRSLDPGPVPIQRTVADIVSTWARSHRATVWAASSSSSVPTEALARCRWAVVIPGDEFLGRVLTERGVVSALAAEMVARISDEVASLHAAGVQRVATIDFYNPLSTNDIEGTDIRELARQFDSLNSQLRELLAPGDDVLPLSAVIQERGFEMTFAFRGQPSLNSTGNGVLGGLIQNWVRRSESGPGVSANALYRQALGLPSGRHLA